MGRFKGDAVIITGASAGIGAAAARRFAREGARCVLAARGVEGLEAVAEEVRAAGGEALVVPTDVADPAACAALVAACVDTWGPPRVVVNNAGLHHRGPFLDHPAEAFAEMVDVNLRGPILLTRLALDAMRAAGRGVIVNVASIAGCVPLPEAAVYSATKFGLRAFSRALAEELRDTPLRVTVVSPGPVETGFIIDDLESVSPLTLSQPLSTAEEVAEAIIACALDGRIERQLPKRSGRLATLAYLWPALARRLRPVMMRRGEAAKRRLLARLGR